MYNDKEDSMHSLEQDFTDKLYAAYEANPKFAAMENAISHNGLLASTAALRFSKEDRKSVV